MTTKTVASVKRGANFQFDGTYIVTMSDGAVHEIYRDTEQFGTPLWHLAGADDLYSYGIGSTKAEALQHLCAS